LEIGFIGKKSGFITMKQGKTFWIQVKVHPASSKRGVESKDQGLHLYTTKKPIRGEANRDAVKLLADYFKVPKRCVTLIKGEKTNNKVFRVESENEIKNIEF